MKIGFNLIMVILAVVCFGVKFVLDLFGGNSGRFNLMALGATFLAASFL